MPRVLDRVLDSMKQKPCNMDSIQEDESAVSFSFPPLCLFHTDRHCAVWGEAIQLFSTERRAVALVSLCRCWRARLGTGMKMVFLTSLSELV